ncbi:hypothetical protein POJ06DRAFT_264073 [Lipomyces tetrasporus]|uniref:Uncharacterized protein n=1 Tax=Lipomyces tetrasporus TaxID=54092 RepID=A0AAD7QK70_9ASCO|nr:uncharacterized protein POJ06DRAFT_264073 [Lipomyces tetrasporus]KAJ8096450.1 hypothetical protein POJ06DRAFT_264073 [Lipomyces tetrasporus]
MAMERINGSDDDSFAKLPAYIRLIQNSNTGSHAVLRVIEGQFYSMYVSYFSSIVGFSTLSSIDRIRWHSFDLQIPRDIPNQRSNQLHNYIFFVCVK